MDLGWRPVELAPIYRNGKIVSKHNHNLRLQKGKGFLLVPGNELSVCSDSKMP